MRVILHPCGGTRPNGDACKNSEVPGTGRCHLHGGSTPTAKIKAEATMALLRVPAIEALHDVLAALQQRLDQFNDDTCATCGHPVGETIILVKLCRATTTACVGILDRTGMGAHAILEIKQSDGDLDPKLFNEDEKDRLLALLAQVRSLKEEHRLRLHGKVFGVMNPEPQSVM